MEANETLMREIMSLLADMGISSHDMVGILTFNKTQEQMKKLKEWLEMNPNAEEQEIFNASGAIALGKM